MTCFAPDVAGIERGHVHGHVVAKPLKILGARHEIGFAVDLHHHADLAARVDVVADQPFGGLALGLFLRGGLALAPQDVDGFVDVAARLPPARRGNR